MAGVSLDHFIDAQNTNLEAAVVELTAGRKQVIGYGIFSLKLQSLVTVNGQSFMVLKQAWKRKHLSPTQCCMLTT